MEQAFAVWGDDLELDEADAPTNVPQAERRVAQYLRRMHDEEYVVEPPFEEWELELPW
ncbi:MAG TPA: hypothetical protein VM490_03670 [Armatimonadaceae bacterium]|nr:hypothetical protein [Armatimonadaceae bacterium]